MEVLQRLRSNCWVGSSRDKLTLAVMEEALRAMKATRCHPRALMSGD